MKNGGVPEARALAGTKERPGPVLLNALHEEIRNPQRQEQIPASHVSSVRYCALAQKKKEGSYTICVMHKKRESLNPNALVYVSPVAFHRKRLHAGENTFYTF